MPTRWRAHGLSPNARLLLVTCPIPVTDMCYEKRRFRKAAALHEAMVGERVMIMADTIAILGLHAFSS